MSLVAVGGEAISEVNALFELALDVVPLECLGLVVAVIIAVVVAAVVVAVAVVVRLFKGRRGFVEVIEVVVIIVPLIVVRVDNSWAASQTSRT